MPLLVPIASEPQPAPLPVQTLVPVPDCPTSKSEDVSVTAPLTG